MTPKESDLIIRNGTWTIERLHQKYPTIIELMTSAGVDDAFLAKRTIIVDKEAELDITNDKIFL